MLGASNEERIESVRRFNRFYTQQIGVLNEGLLGSPLSLSEARVLYETAHLENPTATDIARRLGLDMGYMSRILRGFEQKGLIERHASESDARQSLLFLTSEGREAFGQINARAREEVREMLNHLPEHEQERLVAAMGTIESLLEPRREPSVPYLLRSHRPGDMGWVVNRHGVIYSREYGYDETFEALVAGVVSKFIFHFDPKREHCWIAERQGKNVGSVFLVRKSKTVAKLRMLIVDPEARGLGIGKRLVEECIRMARQVGYKKLTLWTHSQLLAARSIYKAAGFCLARAVPNHSFGLDLVDETWDLKL